MTRTIALCLALGAALGLQGCSAPAVLAVGSVTAATFAVDQKLPPDYVAGWITGKDCSSLELEKTGQYCRTPEEIAAAQAAANRQPVASYCYRTLGVVDCTPEPVPGEEARLVH